MTWFLLRNWKPRILSVHPPIKIWRQISLAFVRSFHLSFKSILQINLIFLYHEGGMLFRWWLCHNAGNNCYIKAWAASRTLICSLRHHLIFFSFIHKLQGPGSKDSALVYHKITPQYIKLNGRNLCWLIAYCLEQTFCFQGCPWVNLPGFWRSNIWSTIPFYLCNSPIRTTVISFMLVPIIFSFSVPW